MNFSIETWSDFCRDRFRHYRFNCDRLKQHFRALHSQEFFAADNEHAWCYQAETCHRLYVQRNLFFDTCRSAVWESAVSVIITRHLNLYTHFSGLQAYQPGDNRETVCVSHFLLPKLSLGARLRLRRQSEQKYSIRLSLVRSGFNSHDWVHSSRMPHTGNLFKRCVSYLANCFYKYWIVELDIQKNYVWEANEPRKLKVIFSN